MLSAINPILNLPEKPMDSFGSHVAAPLLSESTFQSSEQPLATSMVRMPSIVTVALLKSRNSCKTRLLDLLSRPVSVLVWFSSYNTCWHLKHQLTAVSSQGIPPRQNLSTAVSIYVSAITI